MKIKLWGSELYPRYGEEITIPTSTGTMTIYDQTRNAEKTKATLYCLYKWKKL